jgi:uncharacterized protein YgiM (DUF1202 family)
MRAGASTSSAILAKYPRGTVFTLLSSNGNGWVKVKARDGHVGWVYASLVILR